MNDERLAEIEALAEGLPERWIVDEDGDVVTEEDETIVCLLNTRDRRLISGYPEAGPFIAAARTAVPELAAEVRRLRAEIARLGCFCGICHAAPGESCACPGRGV